MEEVSFPLFFLLSAFCGTTTTMTFPVFPSSPFTSCKSTPPRDSPACLSGPPERIVAEVKRVPSVVPATPSVRLPLWGLWRAAEHLVTLPAPHGDCGGCSRRVQWESSWRWCATKPHLVVLWISCYSLLSLFFCCHLSILCRRPSVVPSRVCRAVLCLSPSSHVSFSGGVGDTQTSRASLLGRLGGGDVSWRAGAVWACKKPDCTVGAWRGWEGIRLGRERGDDSGG